MMGMDVRTWNTFTTAVIVLIFTTQFLRWCSSRFRYFQHATAPPPSALPIPQPRTCAFVSDSDLKDLLLDLNDSADDWESVIDKTNNLFSYTAKRMKPKDGPVKYMSITVFENCSAQLLRDFYMDNKFRKTWDKTLIEHEQLYMDVHSGIEVGRTIKKFPFLTPREYILVWKVWEDKCGAFYCLSKGCEHPLAPRQKKYVRVMYHRSGWRIREVAGRNACEIRMLHQEDAGLNVEMAKLAFAKGIWSYICRMNDALRTYSFQYKPTVNAAMLIQKFPPGLEAPDEDTQPALKTGLLPSKGSSMSKPPSMRLLKNGLILVGGAICLSRGHSNLGAKVAMVYIITKLTTKYSAFNSKASKP